MTDHIDARQRRDLLLAWLDAIRENIEEQGPPSVRKERALKELDGWLDDLPTFALIMQ